MEDMGGVSKVTQPTPWCTEMDVAPRTQAGQIRLCVDLKHLNKWGRHRLAKVDHTLAMLNRAKVFTKLDATSGFWRTRASLHSHNLHHFIGAYAFNHLSLGFLQQWSIFSTACQRCWRAARECTVLCCYMFGHASQCRRHCDAWPEHVAAQHCTRS